MSDKLADELDPQGKTAAGYDDEQSHRTPEEMAEILRAMEEELGIGRKEALPLENKKGWHGPISFQTASTGFGIGSQYKLPGCDIAPEDRGLDELDNGQSHRPRMQQALRQLEATRGGHIQGTIQGVSSQRSKGGSSMRGKDILRSRDQNTTSNDNASSAFRGGAIHGIAKGTSIRHKARITANEAAAKLTRKSNKGDKILTPTPNLSYDDQRSVNNLPIRSNIADHVPPKINHEKLLADPSAFFAAMGCQLNSTKAKTSVSILSKPSGTQVNTLTPTNKTSIKSMSGRDTSIKNKEPEQLSKHVLSVKSATSVAGSNASQNSRISKPGLASSMWKPEALSPEPQAPLEPPTAINNIDEMPTFPSTNSDDSPARVHISRQVEPSKTKVSLGNGTAKIITDYSSKPELSSLRAELEHGETVFREAIYQDFAYMSELSTISFAAQTTSGQQVRYILRYGLPLYARQMSRHLDSARSLAPFRPSEARVAPAARLVDFDASDEEMANAPLSANMADLWEVGAEQQILDKLTIKPASNMKPNGLPKSGPYIDINGRARGEGLASSKFAPLEMNFSSASVNNKSYSGPPKTTEKMSALRIAKKALDRLDSLQGSNNSPNGSNYGNNTSDDQRVANIGQSLAPMVIDKADSAVKSGMVGSPTGMLSFKDGRSVQDLSLLENAQAEANTQSYTTAEIIPSVVEAVLCTPTIPATRYTAEVLIGLRNSAKNMENVLPTEMENIKKLLGSGKFGGLSDSKYALGSKAWTSNSARTPLVTSTKDSLPEKSRDY